MVKKKRQSDAVEEDSSSDCEELKSKGSPTATAMSACQHLKHAVDTNALRKILKTTGLVFECSQCNKQQAASPAVEASEDANMMEYDNTLWLCLRCGSQLCGRSRNKHALQHFKTPRSDSHALSMNTRNFEIWCYECDNKIQCNSRKSLLECVEMVKKAAQKPPLETKHVQNQIIACLETINPLLQPKQDKEDAAMLTPGSVLALPPPLPPPPYNVAIPGMAKRIIYPQKPTETAKTSSNTMTPSAYMLPNYNANVVDTLPRVRGLTNLGNTCFFNAVMQCLAQTPYLLEVLKESSEPGEGFILPGGTFKIKDEVDMVLPPIQGTLSNWGTLTAALAQSLEELQSGGGVFTPGKLFDKLCTKCPQFRGGDQHDSHELLRHLLESVKSEDLKRYQRVILQNLDYKCQDISQVPEEMRQKCKIYGNQAQDRILRPEQVFRGFMVSTLTCQDCYHNSSRHEYFLDMSLPVSVEKSQPPCVVRRKNSPDNEVASTSAAGNNAESFFLNPPPPYAPTKSQLKKEKEEKRKAKRATKHHKKKLAQQQMLNSVVDSNGSAADVSADNTKDNQATNQSSGGVDPQNTAGSGASSCSSSDAESDADVEDNLQDDSSDVNNKRAPPCYDSNGNKNVNNSQLPSPMGQKPEKRGDSPENMDKDSLDEDENDSGIATSPANTATTSSFPTSENTTNGGASSKGEDDGADVISTNSLMSVGLGEKGANIMRQLSLGTSEQPLTNGDVVAKDIDNDQEPTTLVAQLEQLQLKEQRAARMRARRTRTQSNSDWSTTIAPRYQCEDGECSVQSCLNNFTAVELMTGNNKVGCENCTRRINGDDPKAKTVNTNATKQFLISSPPAVLILHLKRFQLGPRCIFRKLTRAVSFPMILDIAPFCGSKVKNLPNIDRKQKKLLYSLYGIVEHSGGMYGGHYVAYVKVRPKLLPDDKRWKFIPQGSKAELDQDDEQRKKLEELLAKEQARELRLKAANDSDDFSNSSGSSTCSSPSASDREENLASRETAAGVEEAHNVQEPPGKWYYVSDSRVQEVSEDTVLKAQAYLLFYERIY